MREQKFFPKRVVETGATRPRTREVYAREDAIKAAGVRYLPRLTEGGDVLLTESGEELRKEDDE